MTNDDIFAARLARNRSGAECTRHTVFVGQQDRFQRDQAVAPPVSRSRDIARSMHYPAPILGPFALGLFAVALGNYARFHVTAGRVAFEDADLEMGVAIVIGLAVSFVLAQMLRLTAKEHKAAQGAGVFAMVCAFHNFAHRAPGPMSVAFSSDHVLQIQAEAPPNSARFRGSYIPLFEDGSTLHADLEPEGLPIDAAAGGTGPDADGAPGAPRVTILQLDSAKAPDRAVAACAGG